MRILLINDYLEKVGGAEILVHKLKEVLERNGHVVRILGSSDKENKKSFFSRWFSLKWYRETQRVIRDFKPDVVHVHNCGRVVSPSVIKASLNTNVPTVLSVHDIHYTCTKAWGVDSSGTPCRCWSSFSNTLFTRCLGGRRRRFSFPIHLLKILRLSIHRRVIKDKRLKIICASEYVSNLLRKSLGVKVAVVPFGFDIPSSQTSYEKKILFMGRISPENGLQEVIGSLDKVKGFEVLICGDGSLKKELESKYKNVNFLGWQTNPGKFYDRCMISVAPALWISNQTLGIFEAMSHGLCVMTVNRGGTAEQVKHLDTGIIFRAQDKEDFEEKLNFLIKNPKEIKRIGKNAREYVKKNHDWKKVIKIYEDKYAEAIKSFKS